MENLDLSTTNLRDTDLRGKNLIYTNLRGADLSNANLRGADLRDTDLIGANLIGANLIGANLIDADLLHADLRNAILINADLRDANLEGVNLSGADLEGANLCGADLEGANLFKVKLRGAKLLEYRKGKILTENIIGYKKCRNDVIVTLEIPRGAIVFSINGNICRTNKAKVIDIDGANRAFSIYNKYMSYYIGDEFTIYDFDCQYNIECSTGIHFYMTREEAENFQ